MPQPVESLIRNAPLLLTIQGSTGQFLSPAVDLTSARLAWIGMPAAWTAASLTFRHSPDNGTTWLDVYNSAGVEYTVTAAASHTIIIPYADFFGLEWIMIRSGTGASPVAQAADRILTLGGAA